MGNYKKRTSYKNRPQTSSISTSENSSTEDTVKGTLEFDVKMKEVYKKYQDFPNHKEINLISEIEKTWKENIRKAKAHLKYLKNKKEIESKRKKDLSKEIELTKIYIRDSKKKYKNFKKKHKKDKKKKKK